MEIDSKIVARSIRQLAVAVWAATIALVAVLVFWIISWVFPPPYISQFTGSASSFEPGYDEPHVAPTLGVVERSGETPFHELSVEQQIEQASMIALAEYEEGEDGRMRAIIREILKKEPGTVSYFDVGDEHGMHSFYDRDDRAHGDGVIIFFTGSPARMALSMTYRGERIGGLGDMPLALFREKCNG
jgi:hypothetical protein